MTSLARLLADWWQLVQSPRARPYLLLTLFVDAALVFVFLLAIQSYLPEQYSAGAALPGYALAAYGAAKLAGQLLGGRIIDRIGARRGLFSGLGLLAAGQLALLAAAVQPEAALPAAAVYGLGGALVWPAAYALASSEFAQEERAKLASGMLLTTGSALALGLGLGIVLPVSFPYLAAIALGLMAVVLAAAAAAPLLRADAGGLRLEAGEAPAHVRDVIRKLLDPQRIGLSTIVILQSTALGALIAVFRAYGRDVLGVSLREEALFLVPGAAIGAGAAVLGGAISDRVGRIPLIGSGFLVGGLAVWGLSTVTGPAPVVPLAAAGLGLGLGLAVPSVSALYMDLSRGAGRGTILGWFMTMEGLGQTAGPALGARLSETAGTAAVFWLVGGLFACISLVAFVPPLWSRGHADLSAPRRYGRRLVGVLLKGGLVVAVGLPPLATYWAWTPSSQVYGDIITHGPRDQMTVALTFDDGPNDPWTSRIVDVLDRYQVKGTFFVVGKNADAHPEVVRRLVADSHLVGNHSYRHQKRDAIFEPGYGELEKAERSIAKAAGVCPALFRPPNGFHTPWQLHAVASHQMRAVTWDVIPRDWKRPTADAIVKRVLSSVHPGSIILLHDGDDTNQATDRSETLAALPGIIEGLRANGYHLARLDELLSTRGYLPSCPGLGERFQ